MGKNSKAYDAKQRRQYREEKLRREAEAKKRENRLMWTVIGIVLGAILLVTALSLFFILSPDSQSDDDTSNYVRMLVSYTDKDGKQQSGDIVIELYPDKAPITVQNFKKLVSEGFYDGLTFHRVYSGFMIQGGDPDGDGSGGAPNTIKGEFSSNGVANDLSHTRGVVSMARSNSPDSASSQFFIMHADKPTLDGNYAAFGRVVSGMEIVDGIAATEVIRAPGSIDAQPTKPVHPVTIQKMALITPDK